MINFNRSNEPARFNNNELIQVAPTVAELLQANEHCHNGNKVSFNVGHNTFDTSAESQTTFLIFAYWLYNQSKRIRFSWRTRSMNEALDQVRQYPSSYTTPDQIREQDLVCDINVWVQSRTTAEYRNLMPVQPGTEILAASLTQTPNHFLRIYQLRAGTHIYTSNTSPSFQIDLIVAIGWLYPNLKLPDEFIRAFASGSLSACAQLLEPLAQAYLAKKKEAERLALYANLKIKLDNYSTATLERNLDSLQESIANYEYEIRQYQIRMQEIMAEMFMLKYINAESFASEFIEYLMKKPQITRIDFLSRDKIGLQITTPLLHFDIEAADKLISTPRRNDYNTDPRIVQFMKNIFIEQKHKFWICQGVVWDISNPSVERYSDWNNANLGYPNAHIQEFNCFGDNKSLIQKALRNRDFIVALEQTISAMAGLNFYDTPVTGRLINNLIQRSQSYRGSHIEADGTRYNFEAYLKSEHCTIPPTVTTTNVEVNFV